MKLLATLALSSILGRLCATQYYDLYPLKVGERIQISDLTTNHSPPAVLMMGGWFRPSSCTGQSAFVKVKSGGIETDYSRPISESSIVRVSRHTPAQSIDQVYVKHACDRWLLVAWSYCHSSYDNVNDVLVADKAAADVQRSVDSSDIELQAPTFDNLQEVSGTLAFYPRADLKYYNLFYFMTNDNMSCAASPSISQLSQLCKTLAEVWTGYINPVMLLNINMMKTIDNANVKYDDAVATLAIQKEQGVTADGIKKFRIDVPYKRVLLTPSVKMPALSYDTGTSSCITAVLKLIATGSRAVNTRVNVLIYILTMADLNIIPGDFTRIYVDSQIKAGAVFGGGATSVQSRSVAYTQQATHASHILRLCRTDTQTFVADYVIYVNDEARIERSYSHQEVRPYDGGNIKFLLKPHYYLDAGNTVENTQTGQMQLESFQVYQGGLDLDNLDTTRQPSSCLSSSLVKTSSGGLQWTCLLCKRGYYIHAGSCRLNDIADCVIQLDDSRCVKYQPSNHVYDQVGYLKTVAGDTCNGTLQTYQVVAYCNSDVPLCRRFQQLDASTCKCALDKCDVCDQATCTKCKPGYYLRMVDQIACLGDIPEGWGIDRSTDRGVNGQVVIPCQMQACKKCGQDAHLCEQCDYAAGKVCLQCDDGKFIDQNNICRDCSTNCATCSMTATNCTSCPPDQLFFPNNSCTKCVMAGGMLTEDGLSCLPCVDGCLKCINTKTCNKCLIGYYAYDDDGCGLCNEDSVILFDSRCRPCHDSCRKCSAMTADKCTGCRSGEYLAGNGTCKPLELLILKSAKFEADMRLVIFEFDQDIQAYESSLGDISEMIIYKNPKSEIIIQVTGSSQPLPSISSLSPVQGYTLDSPTVSGSKLKVKVISEQTINDATFTLRFRTTPALCSNAGKHIVWNQSLLLLESVNLIVTGLDRAMEAIAAPMSSTVAGISTLIMLVSIPQAMILMKVFQLLDYYIYIECDYPSNFSKFLEIISQTVMDYVPNLLRHFADEDGVPVYTRFDHFGLHVHIFMNIGRHLTVAIAIIVSKLMTWICRRLTRKTRFAKRFKSRLSFDRRNK